MDFSTAAIVMLVGLILTVGASTLSVFGAKSRQVEVLGILIILVGAVVILKAQISPGP